MQYMFHEGTYQQEVIIPPVTNERAFLHTLLLLFNFLQSVLGVLSVVKHCHACNGPGRGPGAIAATATSHLSLIPSLHCRLCKEKGPLCSRRVLELLACIRHLRAMVHLSESFHFLQKLILIADRNNHTKSGCVDLLQCYH